MHFDGNACVKLSPLAALAPLSLLNPFTVAFWVRPAAPSTRQMLLETRDAQNFNYLSVALSSDARVQFVLADNANTLTTSDALPANTWTHVAVQFSRYAAAAFDEMDELAQSHLYLFIYFCFHPTMLAGKALRCSCPCSSTAWA